MDPARGIGHEYRLFGLALRSTIELPELDPCPHGDPQAVLIRLGGVKDPRPGASPAPLLAIPEGTILTVPEVARFCIRAGAEIIVDPSPHASDRNVRLFLLGSAMGALLHQRRLLPLHANAIDLDGTAIAFLGHSGAGKSTLAAEFHDRGRPILSDDVCVVDRREGQFFAQPGIPRLRLWRDAIERSGRSTEAYEPAFDTLDKYTVPTAIDARSGPMPLKALYLLLRHDHGGEIEIRTLTGVAAMRALIENTYRGGYVQSTGNPSAHFQACRDLSHQVPLYALSRPWSVDQIEATVGRIEDHARQTS